MARMKGESLVPGGGAAGRAYRDFLIVGGLTDLKDDVDEFLNEEPPNLNYTRLVPSLPCDDPDDAFSSVPYEKGYCLLHHLEEIMGGPAVFEPYLLAYMQKFQRKSISTQDFKAFFVEYFTAAGLGERLSGLDWDHFLYHEGPQEEWGPIKALKANLDLSLVTTVHHVADSWLKGEAPKEVNTAAWSSQQWQLMLDRLLEAEPVPSLDTVHRVVESYGLHASGSSEIRFRYQRLALKAGSGPGDVSTQAAVNFLKEQGRMKFIRPLYKQMYKNEATKELAVRTFEESRTMYHVIAQNQLAKDLGLALP